MKTTSEIYQQWERISAKIQEAAREEAKKADPDTGGNEMLVHNWGNPEARKAYEKAGRRRVIFGRIYERLYFNAFKRQYPDHICSRQNRMPYDLYHTTSIN
jgi:hypothetical protein